MNIHNKVDHTIPHKTFHATVEFAMICCLGRSKQFLDEFDELNNGEKARQYTKCNLKNCGKILKPDGTVQNENWST